MNAPSETVQPREYKYYVMISSFLVSMMLLSNLISSAKFISLSIVPGFGWVSLSGSAVVYPFVFIGGDILTEIYGYARTRRVIWTGLLVFIVSTILIWLVGVWPAASFWTDQESYDRIFGRVPRILLGSYVAYVVGEFVNSFVLAKIKVYAYRSFANKNSFWSMAKRFIVSTFAGQFFDSVVFFPIALYGTIGDLELVKLVLCSWLFKTAWEALFVVFTVPLVRWLKRIEHEDYLDESTDFVPWSLGK
jgi:uncharacterized integral membrane protein (TIGR00697 family)